MVRYFFHARFLFRNGKVNPFRTAVPFGGQLTRNLSGSSPNRDCSPTAVKGLNVAKNTEQGVFGKMWLRAFRKHNVELFASLPMSMKRALKIDRS